MALRATFRRSRHAQIPLLPHPLSPQHLPVPRIQPGGIRGSRMGTGTGTETTTKKHFSAEAVSHPSNRVQVYVSRSADPYLNLSVEHFLLQRSAPDSVVLFLYANRPCVVIGRNQNPWVEADPALVREPGVLARLRAEPQTQPPPREEKKRKKDEDDRGRKNSDDDEDDTLLLVRRRSGGGAVFHDAGNMNYSVICPPSAFDRDKHAEMVARALRRLGVPGAVRVNERHDIVLDLPSSSSAPETPGGTFKISGSAYKLTRARSLHHGTCLLASPNLALIGRVLRSPAAPYVRARGVESVRSPVRNVGVRDAAAFADAVVAEFALMYGGVASNVVQVLGGAGRNGDAELRNIPEIMKGWEELRSPEWTYQQTPQFTFSTHPTAADPRPRPEPPAGLRMSMTVRHGQVTESDLHLQPETTTVGSPYAGGSGPGLVGTYLHRVGDWRDLVSGARGEWLNGLFGVAKEPGS